jgi:hypothetical protein
MQKYLGFYRVGTAATGCTQPVGYTQALKRCVADSLMFYGNSSHKLQNYIHTLSVCFGVAHSIVRSDMLAAIKLLEN